MVQDKKEQAAHHQGLAVQCFKAGNLRGALSEAQKAAELDTQNAKLHNLVAAISNETKDPVNATKYLRHSIQIDPSQVDAHFLLGNALLAQDLNIEAIQAYQRVLSLDSTHVFSHVNLALCLDKEKQPAKAERALRKALDIEPTHADANIALAGILVRKTQYDLAEKHARIGMNVTAGEKRSLLLLAKTLRHLTRLSEAEELYRSALKSNPTDADLIVELGSVLRDQQFFEDAEKHFESAIKLDPKNKKVLRGAGAFFQSIRKHDRAYELYIRYFELCPDDIGMFNNLAIVLRDLNRFEEAEKYYLKCAEQDAHPAYAYNNLGILAMEMGKPRDSISYYRKALEADPSYASAHSNMLFFMNYLDDISSQELFQEHEDWVKWHTSPILPGNDRHENSLEPNRRLRIGYVSADFYGHAVSYFIEAALRHHNTNEFEIFCYVNVKTPDSLTKRLQSYDNQWRSIVGMKCKEIVELVREDQIDILVDLGGHTAGNRLDVFARKPAPIQVTWIGYPNTTGLETIDYRFVDEVTDPTGDADNVHSETLWRLPDSFTCYNSQYSPEPKKELAAKETGQVTFGSFNNASKLSRETINTWARILKAVDGSRLILKSASLIDEGTISRFHTQFEEAGVAAERVEMYGKMSSADHMEFYANVDIGVDPFPYNGTTTSCEALWMGVPIIAMAGDRHAARVTASLLTQMGLGDLAATNADEYVEIASNLASDLDRLAEIRATLRNRMENSPLCDFDGHTQSVEDAYRQMWGIWCADEKSARRERKNASLPETKPNPPVIRLLHSLGNYSFVQLCKCIGVMDDICMLNDLHPLGSNVLPPFQAARTRYGFFDDEEWAILSNRKLEFEESVTFLHLEAEKLGRKLLITDWCHLDYVAQPFLATPNFEQSTKLSLSPDFDVREIFVMRHPKSQWASYCRETTVTKHVTVEEFLKGYRHMAEAAISGMMVRCEDFVDQPDEILKKMCDHLEITYDADYADNWPFNLDVPSSPQHMCLEDRAKEHLHAGIPENLPAEDVEKMYANSDYQAILDMLGYD